MHEMLQVAVWEGDTDQVRQFLATGADINAADGRGWTPLSRAIERGHVEIAYLLLEHGADVHARDRRGRQPLLWAAQFGPDEIVGALLERGTDATASDLNGRTPLVQAVRHGRTAAVGMLLDRGQWHRGTKGYYWIGGLFLAVRHRRLQIVQALLDRGVDVDSKQLRWTNSRPNEAIPLMDAAAIGDVGIVRLLIERGANVHAKFQRRSALTEAFSAFGRHAAVTQTLLHHGARFGLEEAIVTDDLETAAHLLAAGADAEMPDGEGQTLLVWAASRGRTDAVRLLLRHGADIRFETVGAGPH